jgi:hypothetical protein
MVGYLEIYMSNNNLHRRNLPVPFFSQREVTYKWQQRAINKNGSGGETIGGIFYQENTVITTKEPVSLAWASCNIVSLCMLLHYYGITDDSPNKMLEKYFQITGFEEPQNDGGVRVIAHNFSQEANTTNSGPDRLTRWWTLEQFPHRAYKVPPEYIKLRGLTPAEVRNEIAEGYPVMFSYGAVTPLLRRNDQNVSIEEQIIRRTSEHIAVIRGFTEKDDIILNDPWGDPTYADGSIRGIKEELRGVYSFHIGKGDNTIIKKEAFNEITRDPLHQSLVIRYPHVWAFPFRQYTQQDDGLTSRTLTFSDHTIDNETNQNTFRVNQVRSMIAMEVLRNAGYPISANRFWHDGIHIRGERQRPVYAIGPGRIVAARILDENRMPAGGSNNFVLIRHRVKIDNQLKEFYSHYMHLAPVDIAQRIQEQIALGHNEREKDWLDQIITYIRPKCAIIRIRTNPSISDSALIGLDGKEGQRGPQVFYRNNQDVIVPTSPAEHLANRSLIYFCPVEDSIKQRMETINPDEELQGRLSDSFYDDVDKIAHYTYTDKTNAKYYSFYHKKTGEGNNVAWEIRYVEANNNYTFQQINKLEFIYYRRLLAKLLRGDVTTFAREDIRRKTTPPNQEDSRLFEETLSAVFPEKEIFKTSVEINDHNFTAIYAAKYGDIQRYYTDLITDKITPMENHTDMLIRLMNQLTERIFDLGRTLLAESFNLNQQWFKKLVINDNSTFRVILRSAYPDNETIVDNHVKLVESLLKDSTSSEIDYYFEVNRNTKLGMPGNFKDDENIIHLEIFADNDNIIPAANTVESWIRDWDPDNRRFIRVQESRKKNDFFNAKDIIGKLRSSNLLREQNYFSHPETEWQIRSKEIEDFLNDSEETGDNISLQYAVVQHLHSHTKLSADDWEEIIAKSHPTNNNLSQSEIFENYLSYKWFSKEVVDALNLSWTSIFKRRQGAFAVFYHPVRFLAWLDEYLINNPAPRGRGMLFF